MSHYPTPVVSLLPGCIISIWVVHLCLSPVALWCEAKSLWCLPEGVVNSGRWCRWCHHHPSHLDRHHQPCYLSQPIDGSINEPFFNQLINRISIAPISPASPGSVAPLLNRCSTLNSKKNSSVTSMGHQVCQCLWGKAKSKRCVFRCFCKVPGYKEVISRLTRNSFINFASNFESRQLRISREGVCMPYTNTNHQCRFVVNLTPEGSCLHH